MTRKLRTALLTIATIIIVAICQGCVVDKSKVLFPSAADVEQAFGISGLPDMVLSSAEEYRGVTTLCFELKQPSDSVALADVSRKLLSDLKMERSQARCDKGIFLKDADGQELYANLTITCGTLYVHYGKSCADYPRRYLADYLGVVLPAHKAVSYGYAAPNASHWAFYEFDQPQSPELTDSIPDKPFSADWLCPNADSTLYKVCRFYWH